MADILAIAGAAAGAAELHRSRDPFFIADAEGVRVCFYDLGSLNGMYTVIGGVSFIAISSVIGESEARLVCAHELGHHALHRAAARVGFEEFSLFSENSRREYEANLFAAVLLISDEDIKELIGMGYTAQQIANELCIDERITELKINTLL